MNITKMWNKLNGHTIADPAKRADLMLHQLLDGVRIGDDNREQIRQYLADHLKSMKAVGVRQERRRIRRQIYSFVGDGPEYPWVYGGQLHLLLGEGPKSRWVRK